MIAPQSQDTVNLAAKNQLIEEGKTILVLSEENALLRRRITFLELALRKYRDMEYQPKKKSATKKRTLSS